MKLKKLNSQKIISINISKYRVDWDRVVSKPQFLVKSFLKPYWSHKSICEELPIPGSKLRLDLVDLSDRTIVEISPAAVHANYNQFFHKSRPGFLKKIKADISKLDWAEDNNFKLIEIFDDDLRNLSVALFAEKGLIL